MSKERLEELLDDLPYTIRHSGELEPLKQFAREQAERIQELEIYVDENSKKHANLNVFLQERDTTSSLGKRVVDAVM